MAKLARFSPNVSAKNYKKYNTGSMTFVTFSPKIGAFDLAIRAQK
jgi:hypothetical protein